MDRKRRQGHGRHTLKDGSLDGDERQAGGLVHVGRFERGGAELPGFVGCERDVANEVGPGDAVGGGDCWVLVEVRLVRNDR